jgi:adenine-specific DNA-methyltransferase
LCERTEVKRGEHFEFIVSGNIDRYSIALGNVRFIHRQFNRPVLPANLRQLTESKRRLFRQRKLVLAGMTKRLEAAWDAQGGLALGVSVYAATEMLDNPLYLLGVLNSKLLSYLFRIRFQAKRLAGGFLAINKGQLAKLPIRVIDFAVAEDKRRHDRIVALAQQMSTLLSQPRDGGHAALTVERQIASIDTEIDRLVYSLYALTEDEVQTIETSVRS